MKKNFKRVVALICSLAMVVAGIAYTPKTVSAETWKQLTPGEKNYEGIWTIEPVKHYQNGAVTDWAQAEVDSDSTNAVDGFYFKQTGYSWNGTGMNTSDLKSLYNLDTSKEYTMTLSVDVEVADTKDLYIGVKTGGGTTNMAETIKYGKDGETLEFTSVIKPKARAFQLYVYYGANYLDNQAKPPKYGDGALKGGIYINSLTFEEVGGNVTVDPAAWREVAKSDQPSTEKIPTVPETNSLWTLYSLNDGVTMWGSSYYKIDTAATGISRVHLKKTYNDGNNENKWYWDYGMYSAGSDTSLGLTKGKSYTGTMVIHSDAATTGEHKLKISAFGQDVSSALQAGDTEIQIPLFDYDANSKIEFVYVEMPKDSEFYVKSLTFKASDDDWSRVPDEDKEFSLSTTQGETTYNWKIFAGDWGGQGAKLYYMDDPMKIRIGEGVRWDPASAQVKLPNAEAYKTLLNYTNYYMTITFNSTEEGYIHLTQEGYTPRKPQRIHVTKGENTVTKIFTYLPEQNENNVYFSLTATTYQFNDDDTIVLDENNKPVIIEDTINGEKVKQLPVGTILSDFNVEFSRTDEDGWILVKDSRHPSVQGYDDLVKDASGAATLQAYTNSYFGGRISYLPGYNEEGEDEIAQMGIRLDSTSGSFGSEELDLSDTKWAANIRIPNRHFYNRKDTDGRDLVDGRKYLLRFYFDTTNPTSEAKGLVMVRQGYDNNKNYRYAVTEEGLNMANGTVSPKVFLTGYTNNDNYDVSGGIPFTYNASKTTTTEQYNTDVQIDFSEFPAGTIITNISWEFVDPSYTVTLIDKDSDGEDVTTTSNPVHEGERYTFPSKTTPGYENVKRYEVVGSNKTYQPGDVIPFDSFDDNITVNVIRELAVTITDTNGTTYPNDGGTVETGGKFKLPTIPGIKEYTYDGKTYQPGDEIGPIYDDAAVTAVPNASHSVKIVNAADHDDVLKTDSVYDGGYYELPQINGVESYTYNGTTYHAGDKIGPVTGDVEIEATKATKYTWSINGVVQDTVDPGTTIKLPESATTEIKGYIIQNPDTGEDVIYKPGAEYVVNKNVNFIPITNFAVTTNKVNGEPMGASMQCRTDGKRGIAFGARFSVNGMTDEEVINSDAFETGMLITAYDFYTEIFDEVLDLETFKGNEKYAKNVTNNAEGTVRWLDAATGTYRCGITGMGDSQITRDFIGRAYVIAKYSDGTSEVAYSEPSAVRSIKQVAQKVQQNDEYNKVSDAFRAIVDYCASYED